MPKFTRPRAQSKPKSTAAANKPAERLAPAPAPEADNTYISPNNVAVRWDTSRTSVDRTAKRENFTRFLLGEGKNGGVRYKREEVMQYEIRRQIRPTPTI